MRARIAIIALLVLLAGGIASLFLFRADVPPSTAQVSATPTATPQPTGTPSGSASAALGPGAHENAVLGYRVTLPVGYRRAFSRLEPSPPGAGVDFYTLVTAVEQRAACLQDGSDIPPRPPDGGPDIRIAMTRNPSGISAMEWATTPRSPGGQSLSTHQKLEALTLNGLEAVRLIADNATAVTNMFVIRVSDRMYELGPTQGPPPKTWLDDIARTFAVIAPAPFPTPTPRPVAAPRDAAREVTVGLAQAFTSRDAAAVAALTNDCRIAVVPYIGGRPQGSVLHRSVALFTAQLRERFTHGDLTVTIEPAIQTRVEGGREMYFVRSEWKDPDRTTPIELYVSETDAGWRWTMAIHRYPTRIEYRSPWVCASGSGC